MDDIVDQAKTFLDKRYVKPIHTVASAIQTERGDVYLGVNIDHFSGYVCAETSALATAMNAGETKFVRIAAVRREWDGQVAVANPCGKCRQILHDYTPGIEVAVNDNGDLRQVSIESLLPFSFTRQKHKIQEALMNEKSDEVIG